MTKEQEEVIKRLEKLVELRKNKAEQIKYDNCICTTEDLETVLNIIKEKDKRIKELEEEKKNSIPKQKIKDKIKELANTKGDLATYIAVSERIKVLEELLEEEE